MVENIKVSVIIPVYNAENYLKQCLDSVLNQSLREIEVICVDDGSIDASLEILEEYASKDSRVKVFHQKNQHSGVARNKGIDAARGEYLHFLDADDFVLDYAYEALYNKASKNALDCLKFRSILLDVKNNITVNEPLYSFEKISPEYYNCLLTLKKGSPIYSIGVVPWNALYRRLFIEENNIRFHSLFCVNDRSFFDKVITNAKRVMLARDILVVYRLNQEGSLIGKRAEHFDCHFQSIQIISNQLIQDHINQKVAQIVMEKEFLDLYFWYGMCCNDKKYGPNIREKTDKFLRNYKGLYPELLLKICGELNVSPENKPEPKRIPVKFFHEDCRNPLVSVILPVYNVQDYLHECLDSITNQTLDDIEIICVNDGSTDDSGIILKEYAYIDKRIKIIEQNNQGPGIARNEGLKIAQGEYLAFFDSDDIFEKNILELLYNYSKNHDLDVVVCRCDGFDTDSREKILMRYSINDVLLPKEKIFRGQDIEKDYFRVFVWWPWDKLYRRKYIQSLNIQFPYYRNTEDLYFVCIAVLMTERMACVDDVLVHHRQKVKSSVSNTRENSWDCFYFALLEFREYLINRNIYEHYEQDFVNYCLSFSLWHLDTLKGESHCLLYNALRNEWYDNLKVTGRSEEYFYDKNMYARLCNILGNSLETHLINERDSLKEKLQNAEKRLKESNDKYKNTEKRLRESDSKYKNAEKSLKNAENQLKKSLSREETLKNSLSFRVGRAITWGPRKVRGGARCYKQHGASYTIKRLGWHITHLK